MLLSLSLISFFYFPTSLITLPCLIFPVDDPSSGVDTPLLGACAQDKSELIDIYFPQDQLEKANKDKKHFPPGFKVPH